MRRRFLLFPQGLPPMGEGRDGCLELAHRAGGDLERVIDAPSRSIEAFAHHLGRMRLVLEARERALVVLWHTNPLGLTVLHTRRSFNNLVGALASALWAVYLDPAEDPFFLEAAAELGTLDVPLDEAPIWTASDSERFLILSPAIGRDIDLMSRVRCLDQGEELEEAQFRAERSELRLTPAGRRLESGLRGRQVARQSGPTPARSGADLSAAIGDERED